MLDGIKVLEFSAIGPVPFATTFLAHMGANIVKIGRESYTYNDDDFFSSNRQILPLNLKEKKNQDKVLELISKADVLIEGFRPGKMEALGLAPKVCMKKNPCLIYTRVTGWGQTGPLSHKAGHDINYIALTGALHSIGYDKPTPPLNLLGDFAGGSLYALIGIITSLYHRKQTGKGQVIDVAMIDGVSHLMQMIFLMHQANPKETVFLKGVAPFYSVYETKDKRYLAFGAIEAQFYDVFLKKMNLEKDPLFKEQWNRKNWTKAKGRLQVLFKQKLRSAWLKYFENLDVCLSPVLSLDDMKKDQHIKSRHLFDLHPILPSMAPKYSHYSPTKYKKAQLKYAKDSSLIDCCGW